MKTEDKKTDEKQIADLDWVTIRDGRRPDLRMEEWLGREKISRGGFKSDTWFIAVINEGLWNALFRRYSDEKDRYVLKGGVLAIAVENVYVVTRSDVEFEGMRIAECTGFDGDVNKLIDQAIRKQHE